MSKSFSVDLNQYTLYRPIGSDKKMLEGRVDRSDVVACLNDMGYNNISEVGVARARFGVIPFLEDSLAGATLGVPTNAYVDVKAMGRAGNQLLITFKF